MYNLQWIKLETKIFSNRKIQIILKEEDGDTYFRIWIQLLTISLECNRDGLLQIRDGLPMDIQYFSKIMGKSQGKVRKIIEKFLDLDMLIKTEKGYVIKNWKKYQSVESAENYLLKNKERQVRYREKIRNEVEKNNVTVTLRNTEEEKRIRKEKEIEIEKELEKEIKAKKENANGFKKYQN